MEELLQTQRRVLADSEHAAKPVFDIVKAYEEDYANTCEKVVEGKKMTAEVEDEVFRLTEGAQQLEETKMDLVKRIKFSENEANTVQCHMEATRHRSKILEIKHMAAEDKIRQSRIELEMAFKSPLVFD